MIHVDYSETDTPVEALLRGTILNAVAAVRKWEEVCHRVNRRRVGILELQTVARDALDWILGDLPTDRMTFDDCCFGLGVERSVDMAEQIVDQFDEAALLLLEVSPRQLPNGMWTVSSQPVYGPKRRPRWCLAEVQAEWRIKAGEKQTRVDGTYRRGEPSKPMSAEIRP